MTTNFLNECVFPGVGDMFIFVIMACAIAAPLAFLLSYWDKKALEEKESVETLNGWADVLALVGLDDDEVLTWRESAHRGVDFCFDAAEAGINSAKQMVEKAIKATKETAFLAALPFVFLAEGMRDLVTKAADFTSSKTTAVKAKFEGLIAEVKAKAEAAEAKRLEAVKAQAKALGFVSSDEVKAMIADAIAKHEAKQHRAKAINPTPFRRLRPTGKKLTKLHEEFGTWDLSVHAQEVVLKAVEEMTIQEMREELQCGNKYNTVQLRAKVRAARAAANS